LPEGFRATVFASEPDVQNPIAMAWDDRQRLWIAENYTYSDRTQRFDLSMRDRVLIFADKPIGSRSPPNGKNLSQNPSMGWKPTPRLGFWDRF
jgi:hypothetical protein